MKGEQTMIQKITNNDLSDALKQSTAVLDFSAKWCGPCKMLAPVLENVADAMQGSASFYSIDVDENMDLAMQYRVSSIPCIVILKTARKWPGTWASSPSPVFRPSLNSICNALRIAEAGKPAVLSPLCLRQGDGAQV